MHIEEIVARFNQTRESPLTLISKSEYGVSGAWILRDTFDRGFVLKVTPGPLSERMRHLADRVQRLQDKGYPVPIHHPAVEVDETTAWLQELMPGAASDHIDLTLLESVTSAIALQHGEGSINDTSWREHMLASLTDGVSEYCTHELLQQHSDESRRLLGRIRSVARSATSVELPGRDLVHHDLHHRNVLRQNGHLTAVVDWDGCRHGDALFDVVTFAVWLHADVTDASSQHHAWMTDRLIDAKRPDATGVYIAHMSIRAVNHSLRTWGTETTNMWIARCNRWLDDWT